MVVLDATVADTVSVEISNAVEKVANTEALQSLVFHCFTEYKMNEFAAFLIERIKKGINSYEYTVIVRLMSEFGEKMCLEGIEREKNERV